MNLRSIVISSVLALVATGCDDSSNDASDDGADRGPIGKTDTHGSCAPDEGEEVCGGPAPAGNCWCDAECDRFGDCCLDAFDECGVGEPGPAVSQCLSDAQCDAGQACSGGVCVPTDAPSCDDGSSLNPLCDQKPPCADGQVAAVIGGCFECVDAQTCEPPPADCDDGSSLNPLCDQKPPCADGQVAAVISGCFECVDAQTCEPPPADCDDGSSLNPLCDQKPPCADGEVAAVIDSCFECVDAATCQ